MTEIRLAEARREAVRTLGAIPGQASVDALVELYPEMSEPIVPEVVAALGNQITGREEDRGNRLAMKMLQWIVTNKGSELRADRRAAVEALAATRPGTDWLLKLKEDGKMPEAIVAVHCGLRIFGLSVVTDMCLPDALQPAKLEHIIAVANSAEPKLSALIQGVVEYDAATHRAN